MNRRIINALIIVIAVAALANFGRTQLTKPASGVQATTDQQSLLPTTTLRIGSRSYTVEIASSPAEQSQGLSDRPSMTKDHGMIFPFDPPSQPSFWMKDMRFALDFVWIANGHVVEITPNIAAPAANTSTSQLPTYTPKEPVDNVLELNALESTNFHVGDAATTITTLTN